MHNTFLSGLKILCDGYVIKRMVSMSNSMIIKYFLYVAYVTATRKSYLTVI
jgi:hypothetical protein